jgi:hypothetical protein
MGARELLAELNGAGIDVVAEDGRLVVRPSSKLTDEMRSALVKAKPDLLALLTPRKGPHSLTQAESNAAHAEPWDDASIARFEARVGLFLRKGMEATDADDLAERLHLRDTEGDARVLCLECARYRASRCGNHRAAQLHSHEVCDDLATRLQRCPGFVGGIGQ